MLFNSYIFILVFLPVVLIFYFRLQAYGRHETALAFLAIASLFFYGWWNPVYLPLLAGSILVNFLVGVRLCQYRSRTLLITGVVMNLCLLAYFKYANFFATNINLVFGTSIEPGNIVLPLAISFFTFQQITYLVDSYNQLTRDYRFTHYALFVTFFPQLIAGPIVHHHEMMPQFLKRRAWTPGMENLAVGLTIFVLGLAKKVLIADKLAPYASAAFHASDHGTELAFFEAWKGALAYTFQLYFDFSGYSDMAIGLARLFGIVLPLNFFSPYKANNIIEFWRRWHMTLSRFLRDYLYIPLGGNRKGTLRRYLNLFVTMLLGGLWHGAGWTFVLWGALHGFYLIINHGWHWLRRRLRLRGATRSTAEKLAGRIVTFLAVVVGWVFFRSTTMHGAMGMLQGMAGMHGIVWPSQQSGQLGLLAQYFVAAGGRFENTQLFSGVKDLVSIGIMLAIVWLAPNTMQLLRKFKPALGVEDLLTGHHGVVWAPTRLWLVIIVLLAVACILNLAQVSEFLYFQF